MTAAEESAEVHDKMLAMNEALMLGAVRQHELMEEADLLNTRLQAEINDRIRAEEELRRAQAQLKERAGQLEELVAERTAELIASNKQMEAFIYSIAHDLRAPLRAMQGFSAMLVKAAGETLGETGKSYANRISKSALHMDAMLVDLLAFSRVSQQHIELTPVSLGAVVESVMDGWQTDIQEKNARVTVSGPWPVVLAHEATLAQVLGNLVGNALKFAAANDPPFVRVWAEEKEGWTRVWVEDHGPGIDARYQGRIFDLFIRLDGPQYPGTGVGLAIVKKGVERMGGRLGVESVPGEGSRFWFELPNSAK